MTEEHYLKKELHDLVQKDSSIFEFLQSGSLDGIWYWDLERTDHEYMSDRFWEIFGYDPKEKKHLASEWQEMIDPEDLKLAFENFEAHCADPDHPYDQIVRYRHKNGSTVWVRCRGLVIRDETGKPTRMLGAHTDVTRLKEAEKMTLSIIEAAPYALFSVNEDGLIEIANRESEKLFRARSGAMVGRAVEDLFSKPVKSEITLLMHSGVERLAHRLDGTSFPAEVSSRSIGPDKGSNLLYAVLDLTEKKAKAEEIKAAHDEAENANHAKSLFLANMSHELRTPLNAIIGYADLLQINNQKLGHDDLAADAQRICKAGHNLLAMISEVLDMSKIESGHMELYLEEFPLQTFVDDLAYTISSAVKKNNNIFMLDMEPDIGILYSDLTRLRQILLNLLSNAAKFTENGAITLEVNAQKDRVLFAVRDTGIGLTQEEQERVFDEFIQADAGTTRDYGGTGLGLSLCRRFTEFIGGRIWVESEKGKGSTFHIDLPRRHAQSTAGPAGFVPLGTPADDPSAIDILVVEDDADSAELIRRHLEDNGFASRLVRNGTEAMKAMAERYPSMILLDVMMPEMDGFEFLEALKADPKTNPIPVVMVTVLEKKRLAFSLGAAGYLVKPFSTKELMNAIQNILGSEAGKQVVYVEDDVKISTPLTAAMQEARHNVELCSNLQQGKQVLERRRPDIVVLDLSLPDGHGRELLQWMNQREALVGTPVVVTTGLPLTQEEQADLREHTIAVLRKQETSMDEIASCIRETLKQGAN